MKILLFGGSGQLGFEIRQRAHALNFNLVAPVSSEVDVGSESQVLALADRVRPDVIINSAAYTAVDKAEVEKDAAYRINRDGARNSAIAAEKYCARTVFVSTDYVFSGDGNTPLKESDPVDPQSVYGASKLAGENEVLSVLGSKALVVRTSSLHGQKGLNFVGTMLKLFADKPEVKVVYDQWMSPTWAGWLAEVILDLLRTEASGVVHASGDGATTWFDFAAAIREFGTPTSPVRLSKITAAEFGRPAKRPVYSVFDCSKLTSILGREPIDWREGLKRHLRDLGIPPINH